MNEYLHKQITASTCTHKWEFVLLTNNPAHLQAAAPFLPNTCTAKLCAQVISCTLMSTVCANYPCAWSSSEISLTNSKRVVTGHCWTPVRGWHPCRTPVQGWHHPFSMTSPIFTRSRGQWHDSEPFGSRDQMSCFWPTRIPGHLAVGIARAPNRTGSQLHGLTISRAHNSHESTFHRHGCLCGK